MGIKKFFKTKPPTQEDVETNMHEEMLDRGLPVKHNSKKKPNTFGAYAEYAKDKAKAKGEYAPKGYSKQEKEAQALAEAQAQARLNGNPYGSMDTSNPYGSHGNGGGSGVNPYGSIGTSSTGGNPYDSPSRGNQGSGNPYGDSDNSGTSYHKNNGGGNPYGQGSQGHGYSQHEIPGGGYDDYNNAYDEQGGHGSKDSNPYSVKNTSQRIQHPAVAESGKRNQFSFVPEEGTGAHSGDDDDAYVPSLYQKQTHDTEGLDLNDTHYADEDLNDTSYRREASNDDAYQSFSQEPESEEQRILREEDEEVEGIKGQIRFTKQESVASTRNTLRMAREAEESGKNTMGMLGAQSEILFNTERNLGLAETQDAMAKEKITQLNHYNRNILKPNIKNPFTKNRRLREKEEKIKAEHIAAKVENERTRAQLTDSTKRIKSALDDGEGLGDEVASKYRRDKVLAQAKQYQFEADSEDDEMEAEIGANIDEIGKFSSRLKKLAISQGEELDRQNKRLNDIEERADRLDLNVHVNTARLREYH